MTIVPTKTAMGGSFSPHCSLIPIQVQGRKKSLLSDRQKTLNSYKKRRPSYEDRRFCFGGAGGI